MEKVKVGQITAPVGIKGEIRVFPYTDGTARFSDIEKLFVGDEKISRRIEKFRVDKNLVILKLEGIDDRNTSETLRGKDLFVQREDYELEEDSYFYDDLIGCSILTEDGITAGTLINIIQNTAQGLYEIRTDEGKSFLLPAVKEFVLDVDIENKKIVVHLIEGICG